MTTDYSYSLASLTQILSALEGERRNPNTRRNAIKAIERAASRLGLDSDDVFDAADGLLSGRLSPVAWLAQLRDDGCAPTSVAAEPPAELAAGDEPADDPCQPAVDDTGSATNVPQCAAEVVRDGTGDETAEDLPRPHAETLAVTPRRPTGTRAGSKQALVIAMLRREDGATIEQIAEATGWQRHSCRGAISGALKKKLGLAVTSGKIDGQRVYRVCD